MTCYEGQTHSAAFASFLFTTCWSTEEENHQEKANEWDAMQWMSDCREKGFTVLTLSIPVAYNISPSSYTTAPKLTFWFLSSRTCLTRSLIKLHEKIKAAVWLVVQGNRVWVNSWRSQWSHYEINEKSHTCTNIKILCCINTETVIYNNLWEVFNQCKETNDVLAVSQI